MNNEPRTINRKPRGFTLIELLVVISIIGILAAITTASFTKAQTKARDGKRKTDLKAAQQALDLYYQANGAYPLSIAGLVRCGLAGDLSWHLWGTSFVCLGKTYMNPLPIDPSDPTNIYWYNRSTPTSYRIYSILENTNDPDYCDASGSGCTKLPCQPSTGFNYCVTNP